VVTLKMLRCKDGLFAEKQLNSGHKTMPVRCSSNKRIIKTDKLEVVELLEDKEKNKIPL